MYILLYCRLLRLEAWVHCLHRSCILACYSGDLSGSSKTKRASTVDVIRYLQRYVCSYFITITCWMYNYCHTQLHLGFQACKMEPISRVMKYHQSPNQENPQYPLNTQPNKSVLMICSLFFQAVTPPVSLLLWWCWCYFLVTTKQLPIMVETLLPCYSASSYLLRKKGVLWKLLGVF